MKTCGGCKFAEWKKTASGRLHPSGDGQCRFEWKPPPLPACKYWLGKSAPTPYGGYINRRKENKDDCTYYNRGTP